MALYKDGNPVSGLNSIPRLTLAQYNALNVKPEFWVRTDAPESYKKLSADQVSYDSSNTVKDKIDNLQNKVTILAESTGSKTHAQHIAVLKAVWDTLSTDQRMKCLIKRANQIYMPTSVADVTGRFSSVEIDNQKFYVEMIRMSNTSFEILNGTTYGDLSNTISNTPYTLYLPL